MLASRLVNVSNGAVLGINVKWARTPWGWTLGLMCRKTEDVCLAFQFPWKEAVRIHTLFVRGSLDLLVVGEGEVVIALRERMAPFRYWNPRTRSKLFVELSPGTIERTRTRLGHIVRFE